MHFDETLILKDIEALNSEEAIRVMAGNLFEKGLVKESYIDAIVAREKNFATGLPTKGYSVAIPHTDKEHVNEKAISVGIMKEPVDFVIMGEESETTPVKLVFMLAMNESHSQLEVLQRLMQIFQDDSILNQIAHEESRTKVKDLLLNLLQVELKGGELN
ncbi:PTS sugar transporter subunit IIA [Alkalihalophilus pseudofirmus]|uniref:PTS sugar transporter subunit IIA n=1 Tax=Alkalihalophilus pseudofirmus TaxID=79885 RepID=UPI00259BC431|nr:PTS sugar transporter subunit IIA [Alkalihalophilus pseudofirmus]WEG17813.1 PTS sugar transporter subunit IIA [Alkalihalophilus pseudofirmus]